MKASNAHLHAEFNDPVGGCTRIRKQQCQFGWDWSTRLVNVGIHKPVHLEWTAGLQLEALTLVRPIREARIWARDMVKAEVAAGALHGALQRGHDPNGRE